MVDLAREFGISRKTGYKLLERFERLGPKGLFDESRRPHRLARSSPASLSELFIEAKHKHPSWGPKKLRQSVSLENPGIQMPAASTIGTWLLRAGLVKHRRPRRHVSPYGAVLGHSTQPNDIWCVDYKGQFRLGNGKYCYPLTVTDHFSRYLLACDGFERISGDAARGVFEVLFEERGLPRLIRSDNGAPFASRGLFGLSRLSAWWLKLGIVPERIEPGHPEQNGRHERMHRTLKAETTRPAETNLLQQQERFDQFQQEFNHVRPHEALGQQCPAQLYAPSSRKVPIGELEYPLHDDVIRVGPSGHINLLRRAATGVFISGALAGERIGVRELSDGTLLLTFAKLDLGRFDLKANRFHPFDFVQSQQGAALLGPNGPALLASDNAQPSTGRHDNPTVTGT